MANTRQTRSRGQGSEASGAVASGLGPRGGVNNHDRATSSRTTKRSKTASSQPTSVGYTPRTPTREDMEDIIDNLERENAELKTELTRVRVEMNEVREEMNKAQLENDDLFEVVHKLSWKWKVVEWERRILARSWKRRLRDCAIFYHGTASEYAGLIKGYFSKWAHQYHHGPSLGFIWNNRPDNSLEDFVRTTHYPVEMPLDEE